MHRAVACALILIALSSQAEEERNSDLPSWTIEKLTPIHSSVSRWVDSSTRGLDGFFGTDDSLSTTNKSYLRLSHELEWEEYRGLDSDPGLRFKLDLPTTKERLRLIIESEPEESRGTLSEQGSQRLRSDRTSSDSTVVGLSRLSGKDKTRNWDTKVGAGVKFRLPLDPYLRLSSERLWNLGEGPWQLESYNRLSWFNSDGYSARTRWDVGRPISGLRHLRFVSNLQWQEEEDTLEYSESAEINQLLSKRSAIRYAAVVVGNSMSRPRVNDYYVLTHYRRNLHREILFADIIPELHFPREVDFDPRWALTLRIEMLFSGNVIDKSDH